MVKNVADIFSFIRTYLNTSGLVEFSLSQAHSFLFVYWSINYAERVTNKRVVVLIASEKIIILGMLLLKIFCEKFTLTHTDGDKITKLHDFLIKAFLSITLPDNHFYSPTS